MAFVPWWERDKPIALSLVRSKSKTFNEPEKIIKRLLDSTIINSETGCYEYQKRPSHDGYGRTYIDGSEWRVNKLSHVLLKGHIPSVPDTSERRAELWILHLCHNPKCWNPSHLQAGLPSWNTKHMLEANRAANNHGKYFGKSRYSRLGSPTEATLGEIAEELDKAIAKGRYSRPLLEYLNDTLPPLTEEELDRLEYNRELLQAMREYKDMQ
jgi:hypothetical protein